MLNINSFTKIRFFTLLVAITSLLSISAIAHAQETPEPILYEEPVNDEELLPIEGLEFLPESCVLNLESGEQTPLKEPVIDLENKPVSILCLISNMSDQEILTNPSLTLQPSSETGEDIVLETDDLYILFPNQEQPIVFTFPEVTEGGLYDVSLSLTGEFETKTLESQDIGKVEEEVTPQTYEATQEEENTALYVIMTLLALTVLLALLMYRRKSNESLPAPEMEMNNPEN